MSFYLVVTICDLQVKKNGFLFGGLCNCSIFHPKLLDIYFNLECQKMKSFFRN